jgi:hypothetical protein
MLRHVQRRWLGGTIVGLGVAAGAVALGLALWPLHSNGLRGNAIAPRYSTYVGFYSLTPLPAHPTKADLRRAGVTLPRDRVANRRRDAGTLAAVGILVTIGLTAYRNAGRRGEIGSLDP